MFYNLKNSIIYFNIGVIFAHHQLICGTKINVKLNSMVVVYSMGHVKFNPNLSFNITHSNEYNTKQ